LNSEQISKQKKDRLRSKYEELNLAHLKREITRLQNELIDMGKKKDKRKDKEKERMCEKAAKGKK